MTRRDLVAMGTALGAVAMAAEGRAAQDPPPQPPEPVQARGKVVLYGEGSSTYFALAKMPEAVERFALDSRMNDRLGRLVLAAAERGWEVEVTYTRFANGTAGSVYDVRVQFRAD